MRVCLIPTDTWGVGSYRCWMPGSELANRGHEVFTYFDKEALNGWHPTEGNRPLRNAIPVLGERLAGLRNPKLLPAELPEGFDADTYVLQRRFEWWMPWAIARLRAFGKHVVVELDDLYDNLPATSPGAKPFRDYPATPDKDGWPPLNGFSIDKFNESLQYASLVTVSTPALVDHYGQYTDNIVVLPNYLDWDMWADVQPQFEVERPRVRVGWMGWLSWRDNDLAVIREFMRDWLLAHPHVEFVSIGEKPGAKTVHDYLAIPREQRRTIPGRRFQELADIVATIDIGLVPLDRNDFNECKSWLKGLEYSAAGIVPIATPTQQYRQLIEPGSNGFLASTPDEWAAVLDELVADHELRRRVGANARRTAEAMTIQENAWRWEEAWSPSEHSTVCTQDTSGSSRTAPSLAA